MIAITTSNSINVNPTLLNPGIEFSKYEEVEQPTIEQRLRIQISQLSDGMHTAERTIDQQSCFSPILQDLDGRFCEGFSSQSHNLTITITPHHSNEAAVTLWPDRMIAT